MTEICNEKDLRDIENQVAAFQVRHEELVARFAELDAEGYQSYLEKAKLRETTNAIQSTLDAMLAITEAVQYGADMGEKKDLRLRKRKQQKQKVCK